MPRKAAHMYARKATRWKVPLFAALVTFSGFMYYTPSSGDILNSVLLDEISNVQYETAFKGCSDRNFLAGPPEQDDPRVLDVLRKKYLLPPSMLPYNFTPEAKNKIYYPSNNDSSFHFIDYYVKLLLGNQKNGFYIEAGALDGDIFSNSLWLEKKLGWNGLLIEVDPYNFQHLVWKRRKAWISNTCIAKVPYPQKPVFEFLQSRTTHFRPWVYRANSRALDSPASKNNDIWTKTAEISMKRMQCFPLASYLLALNVTTLDFLSLDIQGHEWDVLKTLPLDKVKVRVIAVEYFALSNQGTILEGEIDSNFVKYMERTGYHMVDFEKESNYIYVLKDDPLYRNKLEGKNIEKFYSRIGRPPIIKYPIG